jgi:hypothetical protein
MADLVYRFRPTIFRKEETYRLTDTAMVRTAKGMETVIPFEEIGSVRLYGSPGLRTPIGTVATDFERCVIRPRRGAALALSSNHFVSLGRFEDRTTSFRPFVDALVARVAAANPRTVFHAGMPSSLWAFWILVLVMVIIFAPLAVAMIIVNLVNGEPIAPASIMGTVLLLGVLFSFGSYLRTVRRNRPRIFDPRTPATAGTRHIEEMRG